MRATRLALAGASAAALVAGMAGVASAAPVKPIRTSVTPSYTCPNHYWIVQADWLKVHTSADLQSTVIGELPRGAKYCQLSTNYPKADGYTWAGGAGYNGSTRLSGWVVTQYLSGLMGP